MPLSSLMTFTAARTLPAYAEIHCKSNFSFLVGASHPDELVERAARLDYQALAVTDQNSLAGVVRAHSAAKEHGLKLLVGAEILPQQGWPIILWAIDRAGYGRLSRLITLGRRKAPKGECWLTTDEICAASEGLLAGIAPPPNPPPPHPLSANFLDPRSLDSNRISECQQYCEAFANRIYLLAEVHRGADDQRRLHHLQQLASRLNTPLVAAGDVHYHAPSRLPLYDVVNAIRQGTTVDDPNRERFPNAQRHLRPLHDLSQLYQEIPEALERTVELSARCHFCLDELRYEYPQELAPEGLTPMEFLRQESWKGAERRYPREVPPKVRQMLEHELALIDELRYEAYFLTVWDLVQYARSRDILCQGRGSAANSAVCYCLGITAVDPERADLLFERFISRERNEAPDIDVDFEHERREEVLQYLYEKYGRERAGLAAALITYRSRSAVRDVGKALGLSLDRVDALAKQVEGYAREDNLETRCEAVGLDRQSELIQRLIYLVNELIGFPRHLSQHVGGMVMTAGPLCELVPIENAAMADRTVISWDKNDLEELGILKVDCLALGMLTAIRKAFHMIEKHFDQQLTLANVPEGDQAVYHMISRAETMGVFQIESRAQMSMLPRLRPRCYYDLVIEVAIVRPGPIQGQMVHPYLRRRMGLESVSYPNEEIKAVLNKTLGVPIFQEQAMKLAVVAAGFTPGEADQLRRAMGAWRKTGVIDVFRRKLIDGMLARGLDAQFADQVFRQIRGFGEYGFPESHAASFALLVYVSAWLKYYYPEVFAAALINSQPMGFYAPAQLIRDAQQNHVPVAPIDVNDSEWNCTLEERSDTPATTEPDDAKVPVPIESEADQAGHRFGPISSSRTSRVLRLGMRLINGFSQADAETIVAARKQGRFRSMQEFARRTRLNRAVIMKLAQADAYRSFGRNRREALWEALAQETSAKSHEQLPLFDSIEAHDDLPVELPPQEAIAQVFSDYDATGLSLKAHPVSFYREQLTQLRVTPANRLPECCNHQTIRVAGIVLLRQRPSTAKGITFVTLEDETGTINLVLHQQTWTRFYRIARTSPAWIAHGRLEMRQSIIHVIVRQLQDLSGQLKQISHRSRDFR